MEAVRRTVELGRAARAQASVKVRQPLRKAVIVASDEERREIERLDRLVRDELNVKELEFVSEEADLVSYEAKPNYRALGPRFGKHMPQVASAIAALDPGTVAEAISGARHVGINIDGTEHELAPDDISLTMVPLEGYEVEAEAGHAVAPRARARRRAAPRGPRARGRARGPERAQGGGTGDHRQDLADAWRRRRARRGSARARGVRRRRDARDLGVIRRRRRGRARRPRSRAASCGSRSSAPAEARVARRARARARPRGASWEAPRSRAWRSRRRGRAAASGSRGSRTAPPSAGCRRR